MARRWFGDRSRVSVEVGDFCGGTDTVRTVDVWAADRWLTCDDNAVYVPHFIGVLAHGVGRILSDPGAPRTARPYPDLSPADNHRRLCADAEADNTEYLAYRFMDWGPTADNVRIHLFREGGTAYLLFSFWREGHHDPAELGEVFVAQLPVWELARVLHEAAWHLAWAWADRSRRVE